MRCFTFFFALLWMGFLVAQAGTKALKDNLDSLVMKKLISVQVIGLGGHTGESVEMEFKNLSATTQNIEVGAGRRLVSLDSSEQDLLVVKDKTALLSAGATVKMLLTAFCCEMHRHSPKEKALFQMGSLVTGSWKNPPQPMRTTAGVTHTPVPAGTDRVQKVTGYLDYELTSNAAITVKIVNDRGIVMATIVEDRPAVAAKHKCQIDLEVYSWPKGEYKVQVWKDGGFLKEAVIRL